MQVNAVVKKNGQGDVWNIWLCCILSHDSVARIGQERFGGSCFGLLRKVGMTV